MDLLEQIQLSETDVEEPTPTNTQQPSRRSRSLIEFPGLSKSSLPQWRKELGERVREVQERRAREAILEAGEAEAGVGEDESRPAVLELLPRAEAVPVNPIVAAALQRIERANTHAQFAGSAAVATMVAYDEQPQYALERASSTGSGGSISMAEEPHYISARSERVHNLAVVPPQVISQAVTPSLEAVDIEETRAPEPTRKPKRLIGDLNDPALNYLDSIPVALRVDMVERRSAPIFFRFLGAIVDILVVSLLSLPVVYLVNLTSLRWQDSGTIGFAVATFVVMGFFYLTISTAFTGRTVGMKLFSLRVVDARTGLIPTGGQSAARALVYMLSLASVGVALLYTFLNHERQPAHDRLSRTAVVRV